MRANHQIYCQSYKEGRFTTCVPFKLHRLPIRVELKGLSREDLYRILTETENSLIKQQIELLKPEEITLKFEGTYL
jgi:ATP-dependent protease HslVU (ClpYQ) ATPase subunit